MDLGMKVHFRKEVGWTGRVYYIAMSDEEVRAREKLKLIISVVLGTPVWILIMAWAAGMI